MTIPQGVEVRAFTARDVAPANALTNHYIATTAIHFATEPATDAEFAAAWQLGKADYPWLAATVHGAFAGYAKAYRWRERAAYARTAEVGIYIEPNHQGRGVGRALYGELLRVLQLAGFRTAIGGIALPNPVSVKLHEALGFRFVGTFRGVGCKFGQWHDVGFWQLDFGP
jgi:phosphinothricin acetyltransferase